METIFDFNPTPKELNSLTGIIDETKYKSLFGADSCNFDIAMLFYIRGNNRLMKKYAKRIKNVNMQNSFWRTISHS
ncbi:MAG: hypothetical protein IK092_04615 [Muribaculaceae bacterium]|nr:hypothetical protein [Muribaculaceae bacterium]